MKTSLRGLCAAVLLVPMLARSAPEPVTLLNVSCNETRAFYQEFNPLFVKDWKDKTGQDVTVTMSHGDSTTQARAVLDGLDADVVTMNQDTDIDLLAERGGLVSKEWRNDFPDHSVPYTSTILFLVRGGNPKGIKDWDDLARPGIKVIVPNPKTTGSGRYCYLAAWEYALKKNDGNEAKTKDFVASIVRNAEFVDASDQTANTFAEHNIGDVLLAFENDVDRIRKDKTIGGDTLQTVFPSISVRVEPPVAIVNKNLDEHRTRPVAQAYLQFLFSLAAQEAAVKTFFRPTDKDVFARHAEIFPPIDLFDVPTVFGSWANAEKVHFAEGGSFDQLYNP